MAARKKTAKKKAAKKKSTRKKAPRRKAAEPEEKRPVGRPTLYRVEYCNDIVAFVQAGLDSIEAPEKITTSSGATSYLTKPIKPVYITSYANHIGVSRETLWHWGQDHEEFFNALSQAKALQEEFFVALGATGAYPIALVNFCLKNLSGWIDKIEQTHKGPVTFVIDSVDREA